METTLCKPEVMSKRKATNCCSDLKPIDFDEGAVRGKNGYSKQGTTIL